MIIKTGIIPRVAFSIGGFEIYWYAILITFGIALAFATCKIKDGKFGIKYEQVLDLSLIMIPVAFIFARLYYIVFTWEYFRKNLEQILNVRSGGLAIYGGIIGAVLTIFIYCKIRKIKILDLLDYLVPCLALGQSIGRWGNYINIEAYGGETTLPVKMEIIEQGVTKYVHPTFLYESIATIIIFVILTFLGKKRKYSGELTYLYIILYSFARFFIESLRTDSLMLYNYKISQILSMLLFITFTGILGYTKIKTNNKKNIVK